MVENDFTQQDTTDEIPSLQYSAREDCQRIADLIARLEISSDFLHHEQLEAALFRVHYSTVLEGVPYQFEYVRQIVNNEKKPLERFEQEIFGYHQGELMMFQRLNQPMDIHWVHDLQQMFFAYPNQNAGHVDLFTSQLYENRGVDLGALLQSIFPDLLQYMNMDDGLDPLQKSWYFHWNILCHGPFGKSNGKLARLLQFGYLMRQQLTMGGMLQLEKEIFIQRAAYFATRDALLKDPSLIGEAIRWGVELFEMQVKSILNKVKHHFLKSMDFDKLTTTQKIAVLKVFHLSDDPIELHSSLNERQQQLLGMMRKRGVIQTKELFGAFEVNRKTLQRDFNELISLNLVTLTGEGRGVKYIIPLEGKVPDELKPFHTSFKKYV